MRRWLGFLAVMMSAVLLLSGCGSASPAESGVAETGKTETGSAETGVAKTGNTETGNSEVILFAAKSLNSVMEELIGIYEDAHPGITVTGNYDSSGTLMTQIKEGAACDVFFSAAQKQMNSLEEDGLLVSGTRQNVVNNQVCVVTYPGSGTKVKGLDTLKDAKNMALADGSVPVGNYTRKAMVKAGILPETDDASAYTTAQVSEALGGIEINECANVGAVTTAVSEGSNEVGTVYRSDIYGLEDRLEILEVVPYDLTGDVIYPVAQMINKEADDAETGAAADFISFIKSDEAKAVFDKYLFDTDVD